MEDQNNGPFYTVFDALTRARQDKQCRELGGFVIYEMDRGMFYFAQEGIAILGAKKILSERWNGLYQVWNASVYEE